VLLFISRDSVETASEEKMGNKNPLAYD